MTASDTMAATGEQKGRRICFVSHDPGTQGAERAMLDMALLFHEAGWSVTLLVPEGAGGLVELVRDAGLRVQTMAYRYWMGPGRLKGRLLRIASHLRAVPRLAAWFRAEAFDVVYTHSTATGAPALAAQRAGIPHVWHMHEFGPYAKGGNAPVYDLGEARTLRLMRDSGSVFVAVAHVIRDAFAPRLPGAEIRVIYQPVPFDPEPAAGDAAAVAQIAAITGPKIIYVGAVTPTKRQEDAVRALPALLARFPEARLILGGRTNTPYFDEVMALARELGVDHAIVPLGYLKNAPAIIGLCDISINCRLAEASPRVLVESMFAGTCVIAAGEGGNVESLPPGTGLLYAPMDGPDLAAKILHVLDHPEERAAMIATAHDKAVQERSVDIYSKTYVALIEDAIDAARALRASTRSCPPCPMPRPRPCPKSR
ncbi:glycosyltransferase family 4 protein [Sagittula sp. S175]|uniref:glycosyltransferase family 4 protein n=1 Tax=Sagittula sp. S175 TaxID=3415129 RepID=UPI003C7C1CA1